MTSPNPRIVLPGKAKAPPASKRKDLRMPSAECRSRDPVLRWRTSACCAGGESRGLIVVMLTPTYTGCPATIAISSRSSRVAEADSQTPG